MPDTPAALASRTRRLHAAILRGDEDRAADHARYLARWAGLTLPAPAVAAARGHPQPGHAARARWLRPDHELGRRRRSLRRVA